MNYFGVILRGLGSIVLGPVFTLLWNGIDFLSGRRSLISTVTSLALSGLINFDADLADFDVDIETPSHEVCNLALALTGGLLDAGIEQYFARHQMKRSSSGLYLPESAVVDVVSNPPRVTELWRPRQSVSEGVSSGILRTAPRFSITLKGLESLDDRYFRSRFLGGNITESRILRSQQLKGKSLYGDGR